MPDEKPVIDRDRIATVRIARIVHGIDGPIRARSIIRRPSSKPWKAKGQGVLGQARPPNEPAAESPRQVRWVKFPISPTVGSGDDGPRAVSSTAARPRASARLWIIIFSAIYARGPGCILVVAVDIWRDSANGRPTFGN